MLVIVFFAAADAFDWLQSPSCCSLACMATPQRPRGHKHAQQLPLALQYLKKSNQSSVANEVLYIQQLQCLTAGPGLDSTMLTCMKAT